MRKLARGTLELATITPPGEMLSMKGRGLDSLYAHGRSGKKLSEDFALSRELRRDFIARENAPRTKVERDCALGYTEAEARFLYMVGSTGYFTRARSMP